MAEDWSAEGRAIGVFGGEEFRRSMTRFGDGLSTRAFELDAEAAAEMVDLMQGRVAQRTGLLLSGIASHQAGEVWTVTASAQKYSNTKDYAKDVEFGTAAGFRGRAVAGSDYYEKAYSGRRGSLNERTGRRRRVNDARRRSARSHPGTDAQPYFLNSAAEVLRKRNSEMSDLIEDLGDEEGLL